MSDAASPARRLAAPARGLALAVEASVLAAWAGLVTRLDPATTVVTLAVATVATGLRYGTRHGELGLVARRWAGVWTAGLQFALGRVSPLGFHLVVDALPDGPPRVVLVAGFSAFGAVVTMVGVAWLLGATSRMAAPPEPTPVVLA